MKGTCTLVNAISGGGYTTSGTAQGSSGTMVISMPAASTTTPYITVTGGGGGGGGYSAASGITFGSVTESPKSIITISNDGDIYRGQDTKNKDGLFARLERLERMLGILRRNRNLEESYEPLRDIGEEYDAICDEAIKKISDAVAGELRELHARYDEAMVQAKVLVELSKE